MSNGLGRAECAPARGVRGLGPCRILSTVRDRPALKVAERGCRGASVAVTDQLLPSLVVAACIQLNQVQGVL